MNDRDEKTFGSWSIKELLLLAALWMGAVLLALPIFVLGFSQGEHGEITIYNFIGLVVYPLVLWLAYKACKYLTRKDK